MTDPHADMHTAGRDRSWRRELTGGYIATAVLAAILGVFGLLLLMGGVWLIVLGGSWYYAVAGAGLCITAWFLAQPSILALWVYLATYAFTLGWAYWEKGFEAWAQVPRLVAPTVVLVLVLLTLPVLRARRTDSGADTDRGAGKGAVI